MVSNCLMHFNDNPQKVFYAGQLLSGFNCNLPAGLPTSLEGDIGYIRYRARVVLDIPLWRDVEFGDVFTVIKPLNLNYDSTLRVSSTILWQLYGKESSSCLSLFLRCSCQRSKKSTKHSIRFAASAVAVHRIHCIWWHAFPCPDTRPAKRLTSKSMWTIKAKRMRISACNWLR